MIDRLTLSQSPEPTQSGLSRGRIALIAGLLVVIVVGPILYSVGTIAYHLYGIRSQVSEGAMVAEGAKNAVTDYYFYSHTYPATNYEASMASPDTLTGPYTTRVEVRKGTILVTFGNRASPEISGRRLAFAPHPTAAGMHWDCKPDAGTTLDRRYLPTICRP